LRARNEVITVSARSSNARRGQLRRRLCPSGAEPRRAGLQRAHRALERQTLGAHARREPRDCHWFTPNRGLA